MGSLGLYIDALHLVLHILGFSFDSLDMVSFSSLNIVKIANIIFLSSISIWAFSETVSIACFSPFLLPYFLVCVSHNFLLKTGHL